jgi:hypothetical protein
METILELEKPVTAEAYAQSSMQNPDLVYDEAGVPLGYTVEAAFRALDKNLSKHYGVDIRQLRERLIAQGENLAKFD